MKKTWLAYFLLFLSTFTFAATEQVVKEDTTPPAAEGALTPDQLPPLMIAVNQNPTQAQPTQKTNQ